MWRTSHRHFFERCVYARFACISWLRQSRIHIGFCGGGSSGGCGRFKTLREGKLGGVGQGTLFGAVEKRDIVINASLESVRTALSKGETPELLYEILPLRIRLQIQPLPLRLLYSRWRANGTTVWLVPFESESASELASIFPLSVCRIPTSK